MPIMSSEMSARAFVLKPSEGLKELWKSDCKAKCASYWWMIKVLPIGQYEKCIAICMKQKYKKCDPNRSPVGNTI